MTKSTSLHHRTKNGPCYIFWISKSLHCLYIVKTRKYLPHLRDCANDISLVAYCKTWSELDWTGFLKKMDVKDPPFQLPPFTNSCFTFYNLTPVTWFFFTKACFTNPPFTNGLLIFKKCSFLQIHFIFTKPVQSSLFYSLFTIWLQRKWRLLNFLLSKF